MDERRRRVCCRCVNRHRGELCDYEECHERGETMCTECATTRAGRKKQSLLCEPDLRASGIREAKPRTEVNRKRKRRLLERQRREREEEDLAGEDRARDGSGARATLDASVSRMEHGLSSIRARRAESASSRETLAPPSGAPERPAVDTEANAKLKLKNEKGTEGSGRVGFGFIPAGREQENRDEREEVQQVYLQQMNMQQMNMQQMNMQQMSMQQLQWQHMYMQRMQQMQWQQNMMNPTMMNTQAFGMGMMPNQGSGMMPGMQAGTQGFGVHPNMNMMGGNFGGERDGGYQDQDKDDEDEDDEDDENQNDQQQSFSDPRALQNMMAFQNLQPRQNMQQQNMLSGQNMQQQQQQQNMFATGYPPNMAFQQGQNMGFQPGLTWDAGMSAHPNGAADGQRFPGS